MPHYSTDPGPSIGGPSGAGPVELRNLAQTPSATSLAAAPNPANYGQPVTRTATVNRPHAGKTLARQAHAAPEG